MHFDKLLVRTNKFSCDQNKPGEILTICMYIGVHNQDKLLPAGTLDWIKYPTSKILFLTFKFCVNTNSNWWWLYYLRMFLV